MPLTNYLMTARKKYFPLMDCPTNLAMLDIYCEEICEDIPCVSAYSLISLTQQGFSTCLDRFSRKALKWELPLNIGNLEATIYLTEPESAAEIDRFDAPPYGQPLEGFNPYGRWGFSGGMSTKDQNGTFWARHAPVLKF